MGMRKKVKSLKSIGRGSGVDRVDRFGFDKLEILVHRSINGVFAGFGGREALHVTK